MNLINKVMSKFAATVNKGLFVDTKNKNSLGPKPEMLVLKDIRLAIISETEQDEKLNESLLKNLTGDDEITARGLNKDPIKFKPKLSPVILTNNKPQFDSKSDAMLRRIKFIPFKAKFKETPTKEGEQKMNKYLVKQLEQKYLNQILKFMVLGAIEFIKNPDMVIPKELEEDMNKYISEINPVELFIKDKLQKTENDRNKILRGDLYEIYKRWAIDCGITVYIKKADFYKSVDEKLGEAKKVMGNYYYKNVIEIKDNSKDDDSDNDSDDENTIDQY
jgi:putative DNA primase/helicase